MDWKRWFVVARISARLVAQVRRVIAARRGVPSRNALLLAEHHAYYAGAPPAEDAFDPEKILRDTEHRKGRQSFRKERYLLPESKEQYQAHFRNPGQHFYVPVTKDGGWVTGLDQVVD